MFSVEVEGAATASNLGTLNLGLVLEDCTADKDIIKVHYHANAAGSIRGDFQLA